MPSQPPETHASRHESLGVSPVSQAYEKRGAYDQKDERCQYVKRSERKAGHETILRPVTGPGAHDLGALTRALLLVRRIRWARRDVSDAVIRTVFGPARYKPGGSRPTQRRGEP